MLAVYTATKEARRRAIETSRPVLIEALTYRLGHHSTSDDSTAYRQASTVELNKKNNNPISRSRGYLEGKGWWDEGKEDELKDRLRKEVLKAFGEAEGKKGPSLNYMFEDVYSDEGVSEAGERLLPNHLELQRKELGQLVSKYGTVWEGWRKELSGIQGRGEDLLKPLKKDN